MADGRNRAGWPSIERLLHRAARSFDAELTARLRARGYTDIRRAHGAVFANIDDTGTRPSELAQRAGMTRPSMTELVADLEAKGYVIRRPAVGDARSRVVLLTRRGSRHRDDARKIIAEMESLYAKRLGRSRVASLRETLARIASFEETHPA